MKKYWVTLEDDIYEKLNELAKEKGLSVGALSAKHLASLVEEKPDQLLLLFLILLTKLLMLTMNLF